MLAFQLYTHPNRSTESVRTQTDAFGTEAERNRGKLATHAANALIARDMPLVVGRRRSAGGVAELCNRVDCYRKDHRAKHVGQQRLRNAVARIFRVFRFRVRYLVGYADGECEISEIDVGPRGWGVNLLPGAGLGRRLRDGDVSAFGLRQATSTWPKEP